MLPPVLAEAREDVRGLRQGVAEWARAHGRTAAVVLAIGVLVALHYVDLRDDPPGFFSDEASVAYDAQGIATDLRDSHGALLPVVFQSFGQWRASLFVYAVAAVFRVAGPGVVPARAVASTFALLTAILLGLLVQRLFRARWLALGTFAVVAVTPWLFTNGRLAYEPVTLPAILAGFLLLWQMADHRGHAGLGFAAGLVLGLSVYAALIAWPFVPLLFLALVLADLPRLRWRLLVATGLGVDVAVIPLLFFLASHPGALTARYQVVQAWQPGHPLLENLGRTWRVYASGFSPDYLFGHASWIQGGEYFGVLALALVVGLFALWQVRRERFWRFVFLALLFAPLPAALASDFSHDFRNIQQVPFALTIMALGVHRLAPLLARERLVATGAAALLVLEGGWFVADYYTRVPGRMSDWQTAGFEQAVVASERIAGGGPILLEPDLFSAETYDPQASEIAFAFFAREDVRDYRSVGIAGAHAALAQPNVTMPGAVVIALQRRTVPGARVVQTIWVTYPDDWGRPVRTAAYQIWVE
jgi:hypothetical protein